MKRLIKKALFWGPLSLVVVVLFACLVLPWPVRLRWSDPESTSFMRYRVAEARARGDTLELRHEWVDLENISPRMARAVILAEDGRFLEHGGVDWEALAEEVRYDGEPPFSWLSPADLKALARAAGYYRSNRDGIRGRSTITQQLAKNLYFTPERSLSRKVGELVVAKRLEWFLSKDRILELYLNTVELGPGLFGVGAAARVYFGTSAADLSVGQAAALAGTLPHPLTSNPSYRPAQMAWRRDIIIGRMTRTATLAPPPAVEFAPPEPPVEFAPPAPDTADGGEPPPPPP